MMEFSRLLPPGILAVAIMLSGCNTADKTAVVPAKNLDAITIPIPRGTPASGTWFAALATQDGDRSTNFMDGPDLWVSLRILDCNLPIIKEVAGKPVADRGDFTFCIDPPTSKLKDYPMFRPSDAVRVAKVGHLVLIAGLGVVSEDKLTPADLETFLGSLDLATLAKL